MGEHMANTQKFLKWAYISRKNLKNEYRFQSKWSLNVGMGFKAWTALLSKPNLSTHQGSNNLWQGSRPVDFSLVNSSRFFIWGKQNKKKMEKNPEKIVKGSFLLNLASAAFLKTVLNSNSKSVKQGVICFTLMILVPFIPNSFCPLD